MAHAYTRSANLRAILLKGGCPEVITNCEEAFRSLLAPDNRNSVQTLLRVLPPLAGVPTPPIPPTRTFKQLPSDLLQAFTICDIEAPLRGILHADITIHGLTYSTSTKHAGNSCVFFKSTSRSSVPGRISHIVQFDDDTIFLGVRRHRSKSLKNDPFARYQDIGARLWDDHLSNIEIIKLGDVICHFACLPVILPGGDSAAAILPLWRGS